MYSCVPSPPNPLKLEGSKRGVAERTWERKGFIVEERGSQDSLEKEGFVKMKGGVFHYLFSE